MTATLRVKGENSPYPIWISKRIIDTCGSLLAETVRPGKVLLVSDDQVFPLYGERVKTSLDSAGFIVEPVVVPAGETAKTWDGAETLFAAALAAGMEREGTLFLSLGGGVVGDLTGFAAAIYLRGVPFAQIPTSLLAQVDSSVGGKVAINIPQGKNLIGAFYHPLAVIADPDLLSTLPERDLVSGLAEVVKYGLIADRELFHRLEAELHPVLKREASISTEVISRCLEIKARVVAADAREKDLRRMLNFGHTLGHALEREAGYGYYRHGEAVALGMQVAIAIACKAEMLPWEEGERALRQIRLLPLPPVPEPVTASALMAAVSLDKKRRQGKTVWVLPTAIGRVECRNDIPDALVKSVVEEYCR